MKYFLNISILLITPLISQVIARAEITECQGEWTNKPCSVPGQNTIEERVAPTEEEQAQSNLRSSKESALHEFRMAVLKTKETVDIRFSTKEVETFCMSETTSIEDCRDAISNANQEFQKNVEHLLKTKKLAEKEEDKTATNKEGDNNVQVVIEDNDTIIIPRPKRPGGSKPVFTPGPFHRVNPRRGKTVPASKL